jgi:sacsin
MGSPPCDGSLGVDKIVLFSGCFVVLGTDLAQRFSDQFLPLRVSLELSWARSDSTIIQMPLHSAEQAANFKFANSVECGDADIGSILDKFKAHASSSLLFMKAVKMYNYSLLIIYF